MCMTLMDIKWFLFSKEQSLYSYYLKSQLLYRVHMSVPRVLGDNLQPGTTGRLDPVLSCFTSFSWGHCASQQREGNIKFCNTPTGSLSSSPFPIPCTSLANSLSHPHPYTCLALMFTCVLSDNQQSHVSFPSVPTPSSGCPQLPPSLAVSDRDPQLLLSQMWRHLTNPCLLPAMPLWLLPMSVSEDLPGPPRFNSNASSSVVFYLSKTTSLFCPFFKWLEVLSTEKATILSSIQYLSTSCCCCS